MLLQPKEVALSVKRKRRLFLTIAETDHTFSLVGRGAEAVWRGKCIHCRRWLTLSAAGEPISEATIEHILPRNHGGTDELENLAIACARCNHEKGVRHDNRSRGDQQLALIVSRLRAERARRWRQPRGLS
jgi:5-methylcytosine-specific restriction endonuclease McrA